jgi:hypothetical protein
MRTLSTLFQTSVLQILENIRKNKPDITLCTYERGGQCSKEMPAVPIAAHATLPGHSGRSPVKPAAIKPHPGRGAVGACWKGAGGGAEQY